MDDLHLERAWGVRLEPQPRYGHSIHCWFGLEGRTIAWTVDWEAGPVVSMLALETGMELHRETVAVQRVFPTHVGFIAEDRGWPDPRPRILGLRPRSGQGDVEVTAVDRPEGMQLIGAAPDGEHIFTWREGIGELRAWPSLAVLRTWPGWAPGVDWEGGYVWLSGGGRSVLFRALDDTWSWSLGTRTGWVVPVGRGLVQVGWHGIHMVDPVRRWSVWVLPPTVRSLPPVSVAADGHGLRVVLGGRPRRFDLDRDHGLLRAVPGDAARLAQAPDRLPRNDAIWHPQRDLVAYARRWPRVAVRRLDGTVAWRLPDGSTPQAWSPDGQALALTRQAPTGWVLEVWRAGG